MVNSTNYSVLLEKFLQEEHHSNALLSAEIFGISYSYLCNVLVNDVFVGAVKKRLLFIKIKKALTRRRRNGGGEEVCPFPLRHAEGGPPHWRTAWRGHAGHLLCARGVPQPALLQAPERAHPHCAPSSPRSVVGGKEDSRKRHILFGAGIGQVGQDFGYTGRHPSAHTPSIAQDGLLQARECPPLRIWRTPH